MVQEEKSFGSPHVQLCGTIYAILEEGMNVKLYKFGPVVHEMLFKEKVYARRTDARCMRDKDRSQ